MTSEPSLAITPDERRRVAARAIRSIESGCTGYGGVLDAARNARDHAVEMGADPSVANRLFETYREFCRLRLDRLRREVGEGLRGRGAELPDRFAPMEFGSYISELLSSVRASRVLA